RPAAGSDSVTERWSIRMRPVSAARTARPATYAPAALTAGVFGSHLRHTSSGLISPATSEHEPPAMNIEHVPHLRCRSPDGPSPRDSLGIFPDPPARLNGVSPETLPGSPRFPAVNDLLRGSSPEWNCFR